MMTDNPVVNKLTRISEPILVGDVYVFPIPEGKFSKKEIEILRSEDEFGKELGYDPSIANFLPDDIRPKGIPKL